MGPTVDFRKSVGSRLITPNKIILSFPSTCLSLSPSKYAFRRQREQGPDQSIKNPALRRAEERVSAHHHVLNIKLEILLANGILRTVPFPPTCGISLSLSHSTHGVDFWYCLSFLPIQNLKSLTAFPLKDSILF